MQPPTTEELLQLLLPERMNSVEMLTTDQASQTAALLSRLADADAKIDRLERGLKYEAELRAEATSNFDAVVEIVEEAGIDNHRQIGEQLVEWLSDNDLLPELQYAAQLKVTVRVQATVNASSVAAAKEKFEDEDSDVEYDWDSLDEITVDAVYDTELVR